MLMAFQTQGEEISPGLRSHAFGLSEAGGYSRLLNSSIFG